MAQFWAAAIGNVGAISADTADNCRACETADLANAYTVHYYRVFTTHFSANAAYIILTAYISRVKAVGYCCIVCAAYTADLAFTLRGRRLPYFTVKGAAIDRAQIPPIYSSPVTSPLTARFIIRPLFVPNRPTKSSS